MKARRFRHAPRACAKLALAAALAAARPLAGAAQGPITAIVNARVYPVSGPLIERGTVVIQDGRIVSVGGGPAPTGARVLDAAGKVITPGFLDNATTLGLVEIGLEATTNDAATTDRRITAAFDVRDAINPLSTAIPVTRVEGITRAVVQPQNGASLIAGQGALVSLGEERLSDMLTRAPLAMFATLGEAGAGLAGGSRGAAVLLLREALQDARDYGANREAFERSQRRGYALSRLDLEALQPVLRGELPLAVSVNRASDILATLRLARDFSLQVVLVGAAEGWMVAADIAAANVPVVINPMNNLPGFDDLGITLENAARLNAAGVLVAFGSFDSYNSRDLKQLAGNAIANGMPWDAALRAVTVNGARIWHVENQYGTLEAGRQADFVIWSGDPFEFTTQAERVFIRGREISMDSRQKELLRRYRQITR